MHNRHSTVSHLTPHRADAAVLQSYTAVSLLDAAYITQLFFNTHRYRSRQNSTAVPQATSPLLHLRSVLRPAKQAGSRGSDAAPKQACCALTHNSAVTGLSLAAAHGRPLSSLRYLSDAQGGTQETDTMSVCRNWAGTHHRQQPSTATDHSHMAHSNKPAKPVHCQMWQICITHVIKILC